MTYGIALMVCNTSFGWAVVPEVKYSSMGSVAFVAASGRRFQLPDTRPDMRSNRDGPIHDDSRILAGQLRDLPVKAALVITWRACPG